MPRSRDWTTREEFRRLRDRISSLRSQLNAIGRTATEANTMNQQTAKRFRVAVFVTPLTILGSSVGQTVRWSSPMPSADYKVDASCSGMPNQSWTYTVTNQTPEGCTVTFQAPVLLAAGTIVVVLAVSPAA